MLYEVIKRELLQYMKEQDLTYPELGKMLGVSFSYLHKFLHSQENEMQISDKLFEKVKALLSLSIKDIARLEEEKAVDRLLYQSNLAQREEILRLEMQIIKMEKLLSEDSKLLEKYLKTAL